MTGVLTQKKAQEGQEKMGIRNTRLEDLESVLELYAGARAFMKKTGILLSGGILTPRRL